MIASVNPLACNQHVATFVPFLFIGTVPTRVNHLICIQHILIAHYFDYAKGRCIILAIMLGSHREITAQYG